jgi:dynein heavy chain
LITAMLRRYLCPEVMNDNYKFAKSNDYYAPPDGDLAATIAYIAQLPAEEDPEVFGLHPNSNISYETLTVKIINDSVLSLQPRIAASGSGPTPDQIA